MLTKGVVNQVKTENVLLTKDLEPRPGTLGYLAKLVDFGLHTVGAGCWVLGEGQEGLRVCLRVCGFGFLDLGV